jgi:hypothetical protein|tara:strand:+ start:231 stop:359 length:129 start_codon:yes stop_codon:yes gene_type:complete
MEYEENNWDKEEAATKRLLDEICKGVEVPTNEESEKAFYEQH